MKEAYSLVKLSKSFVVDKYRKEVYKLKFDKHGELCGWDRVCRFKFDGIKYTPLAREGYAPVMIIERALIVLNSLVGEGICNMASM